MRSRSRAVAPRAWNSACFDNHILHPEHGIGGRKLSQLTARAVGEFRDKIRAAGVTVPTARKILATLHGVLQYAISQDFVAINAARGVKVIGPREEGSKKIAPPSKDDMRKLLAAAAEADRLRAIEAAKTKNTRKVAAANAVNLYLKIAFAASAGVRAGEQCAARWRHVDFDNCELRIDTRVDAYNKEGAPKTAAGVRTVPLSAELVKLLKEWKLRSRFKKPDDLIFPNGQGNHFGHDNLVKRHFLPLFDALDGGGAPPKRFNWHGLRHFAISCWIEAGLAPKTVQTFAGHASLAVTMDRYGHLFPSEDHKNAMDAIAKGLLA
jgi:integrase